MYQVFDITDRLIAVLADREDALALAWARDGYVLDEDGDWVS